MSLCRCTRGPRAPELLHRGEAFHVGWSEIDVRKARLLFVDPTRDSYRRLSLRREGMVSATCRCSNAHARAVPVRQ